MSQYSNLISSTSGLLSYWRMNDPAGSLKARDSKGSIDAVVNGNVQFATSYNSSPGMNVATMRSSFLAKDPSSFIAGFDGVSGYLDAGDVLGQAGGSLTVEFWAALMGATPIVTKQPASRLNGWSFGRASPTLAEMFIGTAAGGDVAPSTTQTNNSGIMSGSHFVATWDQLAKAAVVYVDGVAHSTSLPSDSILSSTGTHLTIGFDGTNPVAGYMGELSIYSRALTQAEITQHLNVGNGLEKADSPRGTKTYTPIAGITGSRAYSPRGLTLQFGGAAITTADYEYQQALRASGAYTES